MVLYPKMTDETEQSQTSPPAEDVFVRIRFAGGRFNSHTIPLDVLPDLAAYKKLVVEVAKLFFKRNNGNRVRVPKGFEDSFQIGLKSIEGGQSAVAEIPRYYLTDPAAQQANLQFSANDPQYSNGKFTEFDEARAYIDNIIGHVGDTGSVPSDFPIELAGFFNPFGQSLRSDEYAELGFGTNNIVRYDTFIRKKIVLSRETTYENSVDAIFTLDGGVVKAGVIHVLDSTGNTLDFRPSTEFEFNNAYARAPESVQLVGTGLYDKNERLRRLLDVRIIYEYSGATEPFEVRLKEISETPVGWYNENNPAPSLVAIEAMRTLLINASDDKSFSMPYLYPLPDGGVTGEWTIGDWEASAAIDATAELLDLNAVNIVTQRDLSITIQVESIDLMSQFSIFMNQLMAEERPGNASQ